MKINMIPEGHENSGANHHPAFFKETHGSVLPPVQPSFLIVAKIMGCIKHLCVNINQPFTVYIVRILLDHPDSINWPAHHFDVFKRVPVTFAL